MNLQDDIKKLLETGLSQHKLAKMLEISQPYLNSIVHGQSGKNPSFRLVSKVQEVQKSIENGTGN